MVHHVYTPPRDLTERSMTAASFSGQPLKYRYTDKFMQDNNLEFNLVVYGSKSDVHDWQHENILDYRGKGWSLPLNKSEISESTKKIIDQMIAHGLRRKDVYTI